MRQVDDAAFVEFAHAVAPALHRTAWVLTSDRQTSEDLVQETLATMYAVLRRRRRRQPRWLRALGAGPAVWTRAGGARRARW